MDSMQLGVYFQIRFRKLGISPGPQQLVSLLLLYPEMYQTIYILYQHKCNYKIHNEQLYMYNQKLKVIRSSDRVVIRSCLILTL